MNTDGTSPTVWWALQILLFLAGCAFLLFGIHLLISAYRMNDPFHFVMTFFSSNLIILISAAVLVGLGWRMIAVVRACRDADDANR